MPGWIGSRLAAGALRVALVASVLIAGTWFALDSMAVEPGNDVAGARGMAGWSGPEPAAGPTDPGRAATRLASTQDAAFVHMVQGVDSLARHFDVTRVPAVWLDARYLADAARYDEVGAYWERYLAFVREARREDRALFRQGFVARLHELGVSPTVISMRLAQAARSFDESRPRRDSLYSRMEETAVAALDLHALLEERTADLEYDPIQADRAPRDPFLQIATEDDELRESIWRHLDRVFDGLEALHGSAPWTRGDPTDAALERLRSQGVGSL